MRRRGCDGKVSRAFVVMGSDATPILAAAEVVLDLAAAPIDALESNRLS
jgi:hypothetical protein